jgi:hypothetical protein
LSSLTGRLEGLAPCIAILIVMTSEIEAVLSYVPEGEV